ncbi:terpenoid synthase [Cubamyces lactineus]|nr:terpenoid synthase [Cubamyces lactineus]
MSVQKLRPFPANVVLKNLTHITAPVFGDFKMNPYQEIAGQAANAWFERMNVYEGKKRQRFLSHRFDSYAGMSFPDADAEHLETCIAIFLWAFSFDDLSDEGALQSKPDAVQAGVDISMGVLRNPGAPAPDFPYAAMLHDIWRRFRRTASQGACNRFVRAVETWMTSLVEQSRNRSTDEIPSVEDFINLRRRTIGGPVAEAMVEYSLDLQIPEYVWEHPVLQEMSKAVIDIMTWPNDLCSFNKEQADGDFQNLVFCIMLERDTGLQSAVDILTDMLAQRVADYVRYRSQLPSFGPEVDAELARYNRAIEQYTQGTIVWYYRSPRYFHGQDVLAMPEVIIQIHGSVPSAPNQAIAPATSTAKKAKMYQPLTLPTSTLAQASLFLIPILACLFYAATMPKIGPRFPIP